MRYVATLKLPLAVLSGLTVAACGGGGGGGGGGGWSTLDTFTKFSAIVPDRPTRVKGQLYCPRPGPPLLSTSGLGGLGLRVRVVGRGLGS